MACLILMEHRLPCLLAGRGPSDEQRSNQLQILPVPVPVIVSSSPGLCGAFSWPQQQAGVPPSQGMNVVQSIPSGAAGGTATMSVQAAPVGAVQAVPVGAVQAASGGAVQAAPVGATSDTLHSAPWGTAPVGALSASPVQAGLAATGLGTGSAPVGHPSSQTAQQPAAAAPAQWAGSRAHMTEPPGSAQRSGDSATQTPQ
jgi:hypothetical protein